MKRFQFTDRTDAVFTFELRIDEQFDYTITLANGQTATYMKTRERARQMIEELLWKAF